MKKKASMILTCVLLAPLFLNGNAPVVHAGDPFVITSIDEPGIDREGLIGYYYREDQFKNLILFTPTRNHTLVYDQGTTGDLLADSQQQFSSIRWAGLITSKETGDFTFSLSEDELAIIEINGKVVSNKGKEKQRVHLEKGQFVPIRIEYKPNGKLSTGSAAWNKLRLVKTDIRNHTIPVQQDELRNPDFNKKETKDFLKKASVSYLHSQKAVEDDDDDKDTDGDSIPDSWEENGYTIMNKVAVKWDDSYASKGYTKFVSSPLDSHTAGDPYTDYEKAARDLPLANAKETFHPLVAAFPSINVSMEKIILSENKDLSNSAESHSSSNWSYTNTEGASIQGGIGPEGISFGISANYEHSETVGAEWGTSHGTTSQFNTASAGYLNANVRYNNAGTGAIYEVQPTTSFVLGDSTIATITAKSNATALSMPSGESYPKKGQNGIALNTMDDFNSNPITLNNKQLNDVVNKKPIIIETDQADGKYAIKKADGSIAMGGSWTGVIDQIKGKTASIIVDKGDSASEKRVAAKDYDNPEDKTPSVSLKEALKLAFPEITEKEGLLYYHDQPIYESSVMSYVDENTAQEIKKQISDTKGIFKDVKQLYDVKLTPKMNFTIKMSTLYDGAENGSLSGPLGTWSLTLVIDGGNTGKKQYISGLSGGTSTLTLNQASKNKLEKNTNYYISLYMKADTDNTKPTLEIAGEKSVLASKQITLNKSDNNYTRVDILVHNLEYNPIKEIRIVADGKSRVLFDDLSVSKVSATKPNELSDEEIKGIYQDHKEDVVKYDDMYYLNSVTFTNIHPLQNYVTKYKVKTKANLDKSLDSYPVDSKGSVKVNMLDYNKGGGLYLGDNNGKVSIYAVTKDGREIEVYQRN